MKKIKKGTNANHIAPGSHFIMNVSKKAVVSRATFASGTKLKRRAVNYSLSVNVIEMKVTEININANANTNEPFL